MTGYRRKKFFFRESSQGKYIFSYFIIAGLATLLFTFLFVYFSSDSLTLKYDNYDLHLGNTSEMLTDKILGIHGVLIFIGGIAIIYFGTRFTHRTIGPLYKIEQTIDRMIDGDINHQIHLRKKDDCKELAEKLNHFNTTLYARLKEMEAVVEELDSGIESQQADISKENDKERYEEINRLSILCGKLEVILSGYNLSGDLPYV